MKWWTAGLVIGVAFLLLYSPWLLGTRELYWREGLHAATAKDFSFLLPRTHGVLLDNTFPMYPFVVGMFYHLGLSMETALRLVSVGSIGLLAVLVWEAGRRAVSVQAGTVAAAAMVSFAIVIEKSLDGYPDTLGLLFMFAAWSTWFTVGAARGQWNRAWIFSCILTGFAFLTIGWPALFYFFVPLVFMRRPLTVWPKLRRPGFWFGAVLLLAFILGWGIPRWISGTDIPFQSMPTADIFSGYIKQIVEYPLSILYRFLPWAVIAWAPFCVAYHPLDRNPIFSRFLRTIWISLLFLQWFSPFTNSRDIIYLAPPLAVMIGVNYWLVIRRHGAQIQKLFGFFPYVMVVAGATVLVFYLAPAAWWEGIIPLQKDADFRSSFFVPGCLYALALITLGVFLLNFSKDRMQVWCTFLLLGVGLMLFYWGIVAPYRAQDNECRAFGETFKDALGKAHSPQLVIYKKGTRMFNECHYLGCRIQIVEKLEELPQDATQIYLITPTYPDYLGRSWKVLATQNYRDRRVYLLKGTLAETTTEE